MVAHIQGQRLVQVRLDHNSLKEKWKKDETWFLPPGALGGPEFPGELIGCWRESSSKSTKKSCKVHYHLIFIVPTKFKKKDYLPKFQSIQETSASPSSRMVKFYIPSSFAAGQSFAFYIGYCAKQDDPLHSFKYTTECKQEYENIVKEIGSDDYFKSFSLKRLSSNSSNLDIAKVIAEWYNHQGTQHDDRIATQRYWQLLAMINPEKHESQLIAAIIKNIAR